MDKVFFWKVREAGNAHTDAPRTHVRLLALPNEQLRSFQVHLGEWIDLVIVYWSFRWFDKGHSLEDMLLASNSNRLSRC